MATAVAPNPETTTGQSRTYLHGYNLPSNGVALEGYCPVSYFETNEALPGNPEYASTYNGVTYHLANADRKRAFDQDPEKYIPAYGGWCALGMAMEDKFPVDPRNFKVVDDRLLLFLRNETLDALELWDAQNETDQITKADSHWETVRQ